MPDIPYLSPGPKSLRGSGWAQVPRVASKSQEGEGG